MSEPISVAVVGHTNVGKTSLLRTLLRDSRFGEVSQQPGTTRVVEGGELLIGNEAIIRLYDTPGLEDSIGLLEAIDSDTCNSDSDGRSRLSKFLDTLAEDSVFHQEAKVIRQLLQDELIFYVIDTREPVLGKYKDELRILSMAARPVVPILNFIDDNQPRLEQWQTTLANLGLHALVEFDTVIFNFEDEKRLYQKMQALMTQQHARLQRLIDYRQQQWQTQLATAQTRIATLLVDLGALRWATSATEQQVAALQDLARRAEGDAIADLLALFCFNRDDIKQELLPVSNGAWELDLFDTENLKRYGLDAGSDAIKGAAVGVGIDALAGGLTLGAAAALGAAAGFIWSTGRRYKEEIVNRLSGKRFLCLDDNTLRIVWLRALALLFALQHRGHASQTSIELNAQARKELPGDWSQWLRTLRAHPQWSSLNGALFLEQPDRQTLIAEIAGHIGDINPG